MHLNLLLTIVTSSRAKPERHHPVPESEHECPDNLRKEHLIEEIEDTKEDKWLEMARDISEYYSSSELAVDQSLPKEHKSCLDPKYIGPRGKSDYERDKKRHHSN